MRFHRIDVDDEVLAYLKAIAEPFVETTPNAVLRRVLLSSTVTPATATSAPPVNVEPTSVGFPEIRGGTPEALRQILEVVHLTLRGSWTRTDATQTVAKRHNVAPQTVLDKYCRQLGLKAYEFDAMLGERGAPRLRALLAEKFRDHQAVIEQVFNRTATSSASQQSA